MKDNGESPAAPDDPPRACAWDEEVNCMENARKTPTPGLDMFLPVPPED